MSVEHEPGEADEHGHGDDHNGQADPLAAVPALLDGKVDGDDGEGHRRRHVPAREAHGGAARPGPSHQDLGGVLEPRRHQEDERDEPPTFPCLGRDREEHEGGGEEALPGAEHVGPREELGDGRRPARHDLIVERRVAGQDSDGEDHDSKPHEQRGASQGQRAPAVVWMSAHVLRLYSKSAMARPVA